MDAGVSAGLDFPSWAAEQAARVERALKAVPGVSTASVNLATESARVEGVVDPAALIQAVKAVGYAARIASASVETVTERREREAELEPSEELLDRACAEPRVACDREEHRVHGDGDADAHPEDESVARARLRLPARPGYREVSRQTPP